MLPGLAQYVA